MALLDLFKGRRRGRPHAEPPRDTIIYPNLVRMSGVQTQQKKLVFKPTPRNLRWFSLNPYARRAINAIKNPIAMLEWEIAPIKSVKLNAELERQIEVTTFCFEHPNHDDSARTLMEQLVEDIMLGAGAIEMQVSNDKLRPLWMFPVDGLTIQIYPGWTGQPNEARYAQIVGYGNFVGNGNQMVQLRNDELMYIRPNPSSATPYGHGPLEIAFNTVSRLLGVGEFAGNVATNARPSIGVDLGEGATPEVISAFRQYWRNEVEGQGMMPIFGLASADKARGPSVLRFYPEGDDGLFLKYQEFLQRELAAAFDLSPQNLGIERDINRNTSETAVDRDRQQAIKPYAHLIAAHLTRDVIRGKLGFSQLEFKFRGLEADDELNLARVFETEYQSNAITPNQYREQRGEVRIDNEFADLLFADVEIAKQAARGLAQNDDKNLGSTTPKPNPKTKKGLN
jgi:hypothetical protein